jgi:hypothetical protein
VWLTLESLNDAISTGEILQSERKWQDYKELGIYKELESSSKPTQSYCLGSLLNRVREGTETSVKLTGNSDETWTVYVQNTSVILPGFSVHWCLVTCYKNT